MSNLICKVQNCCHNEKGLCNLSKITIEGPSACQKEQTCCFCFSEQTNNNKNKTCACNETDITCHAGNCKHNSHCKCTANDVEMGKMCKNPCVISETECDCFCTR